MQPTIDNRAVMHKLIELSSFLGVRPLDGEEPAEFASRALAALDRRIEFLDDEVRFQILALINARAS